MGWAGISVVWPRDGESDEDALASHTAGYITLEDDGPCVAPGPEIEPPSPSVEWDDVMAQLERLPVLGVSARRSRSCANCGTQTP